MVDYRRRIIDDELDELLPSLAAVAIDGAKGVGKTATARERASTFIALDDPATLELLSASPSRIASATPPVVIDEWQRLPTIWDRVRRIVDDGAEGGRFLLTGSAAPTGAPIHSGAGRIVRLRMRPLSLAERGPEKPTVSLAGLLDGGAEITGSSSLTLEHYVDEIADSGFPGLRALPARARRSQLDGYIANLVDREFAEQGVTIRRPAQLRAWLAAYSAASASTANYSTILDAATPGQSEKPARSTSIVYRDVLEQLWILDPVPAWIPVSSPFGRLASTPKHFVTDPALALRLLDLDRDDLLSAATPTPLGPQHGSLLGRLFESLVALSLQTYAQAAEARVSHFRSKNGDREVDFVIHRGDHTVVAVEVKLAPTVDDADVRHLHWLRSRLGGALTDAIVVTTGQYAYRRADGIAVVPAALLGP